MSHSDATEPGLVGRPRRSLTTILAFVLGVPLGVGALSAVEQGLVGDAEVQRYLSHPVEKVTLVLFCVAMMALLCKLLGCIREWLALRREALPPWDGQPVAVTEARNLRQYLADMSRSWLRTLVGRRTSAVLEFVDSRRCANDLDDHLRGLTDTDDIALDGSYALIRFITWAMPILGFLGTVLGITEAIAGVNPDVLEKNLGQVTGGLATAFDTTALALALTMVVMFFTFVTERSEQGILEAVNRHADEQLAHRFERTGPESGEFVNALRQNVDVLVKATEQLVQRQATVWNQTLVEARKAWEETGTEQQQTVTAALNDSLQQTLEQHALLLQEQEQRSHKVGSALLEQMRQLTAAVTESAREQSKALAESTRAQSQVVTESTREQSQVVTESTRTQSQAMVEVAASINAQTQVLAQLAEGGSQLIRLQDALQQNLQAVALAAQFEQAVNSLTAAIHLLTARASGTTAPATVPLPNRLSRPGAAA